MNPSISNLEYFRTESDGCKNSCSTQTAFLQESGATIPGDQIIRIPGNRHRNKKSIVRIIGFDMRGEPVENDCALQIVDHCAYQVRLQHRLKF
jgi:hypothetical protein